MKRTLLALVVTATVATAFAPAASAAYDGTSCRGTSVTWTNDPCAGNQWGIVNVKAPQAWSVTRGAAVTVAVVDTGSDFEHPDLGTPGVDPVYGYGRVNAYRAVTE